MAARLELLKGQFFDSNGDPLSGGLIYTYQVGTTTEKATYTSAGATVEQANPIVLNSRGEADSDIYGDGYYKIVLKDSDEATIWTIASVCGINTSDMTTIGDYSNDLDAAITSISSTATTLVIDGTATMSANVTVPSTCKIVVDKGGSINQSTYSLTINGPFEASPMQVFTGSGTVSFGSLVREILPEWWGIDGTADDVQINAAVTAASVNQTVGCYGSSYTCSSAIALNKAITLKLGFTTITSTADPVVQITADDVTISGVNRMRSIIKNTTATESVIRSVGATRDGLTFENLYLQGAGTAYAAQDRETEQLIWLGDDPDAGTHTNITIRNNYFTASLHGVLLQFVDDSKIIDNEFYYSNNGNIMLNMWSCNRNVVKGNNFYDSGGFTNAIEVLHHANDPSIGNVISGNTFYGEYDHEVILVCGQLNVISNNSIEVAGGALTQGIQIKQPTGDSATRTYENIVEGNTIKMTDSAAQGAIALYDAGDNYGVSKNIVKGNIIDYAGASSVIGCTGQNIDNNLIEGNIINDSGNGIDGVILSGSTLNNNIIKNNWISGCGRYGIYSNSAESTTIDGNEVYSCTSQGIYISNGDNHILTNNRASGNGTADMAIAGSPTFDYIGGNVPNYEDSTANSTANRLYLASDLDSTAGAFLITIPDGYFIGQRKVISMSVDGGDVTCRVTHHVTSDPEDFTFDDVDETLILEWSGTEWVTIYATATT